MLIIDLYLTGVESLKTPGGLTCTTADSSAALEHLGVECLAQEHPRGFTKIVDWIPKKSESESDSDQIARDQ